MLRQLRCSTAVMASLRRRLLAMTSALRPLKPSDDVKSVSEHVVPEPCALANECPSFYGRSSLKANEQPRTRGGTQQRWQMTGILLIFNDRNVEEAPLVLFVRFRLCVDSNSATVFRRLGRRE